MSNHATGLAVVVAWQGQPGLLVEIEEEDGGIPRPGIGGSDGDGPGEMVEIQAAFHTGGDDLERQVTQIIGRRTIRQGDAHAHIQVFSYRACLGNSTCTRPPRPAAAPPQRSRGSGRFPRRAETWLATDFSIQAQAGAENVWSRKIYRDLPVHVTFSLRPASRRARFRVQHATGAIQKAKTGWWGDREPDTAEFVTPAADLPRKCRLPAWGEIGCIGGQGQGQGQSGGDDGCRFGIGRQRDGCGRRRNCHSDRGCDDQAWCHGCRCSGSRYLLCGGDNLSRRDWAGCFARRWRLTDARRLGWCGGGRAVAGLVQRSCPGGRGHQSGQQHERIRIR